MEGIIVERGSTRARSAQIHLTRDENRVETDAQRRTLSGALASCLDAASRHSVVTQRHGGMTC